MYMMSLQCCIGFRWLGFVDSGCDEGREQPNQVVRPLVEAQIGILIGKAAVEEVLAQRVANVRVFRRGDDVGEQSRWPVGTAPIV
jgi:hypothetical protein